MLQQEEVKQASTTGVVEQGAPAPIGHYSHYVELDNGVVYLSGQKAWKPENGELLQGDMRVQTELVIDNIEAILIGIGLSLDNVTRVQCYLSGEAEYRSFNEVYARRLGDHLPARSVLVNCGLRGGALVELVADAYRGA